MKASSFAPVFFCPIGAPKNFGSREGVVILLGRAWAEDGRSRYGEGGMEGDVRGRAAAGRTAPLRTPREALSPDPVQRSGLENLRICRPGLLARRSFRDQSGHAGDPRDSL